MNEKAFRYGENNLGLGMLTIPYNSENAPIVVMLNAGLLHRAEPYRLNVLAARQLAEIGYICLRVDLANKGDTPTRKGLINRESVSLDWSYMKKALEQQFGPRNYLIFGLCSGADNGVKLAAEDPSIKGLILLDGVSLEDKGFEMRTLRNKIFNPIKILRIPTKPIYYLQKAFGFGNNISAPEVSLRDAPTDTDIVNCFSGLLERDGACLAIFTSHATTHYNQQGQFCRALGLPGVEKICDEIFWPAVDHTFRIQVYRDRLLNTVSEWGATNLHKFILN